MTCVVAYVDKNGRSHMAADSIGCDSSNRTQMSTKKVFTKGAMLFGFCGDFRAGQIVQYCCRFPAQVKKDDVEYLVTDVIPEIQEQFKNNNYSGEDEDSYGFMVILNGNIYEIEHPFQVIPYSKKYAAMGSGMDFATAYMYTMQEELGLHTKSPQTLLEGAIRCASEFIINVGGRIDYIKK